ncbi:MAG: hypothetical protein H7Z37_02950 [Pyrinomonadaceae bacterium]|nr:hypothetical protein [Pyrinomonadaceae bacterium]
MHVVHQRFEAAETDFRSALEIDSTNATIYADAGMNHLFAREKDKAKEFCQKAIEINASNMFAIQCLNDVNATVIQPFTLVYLKANPRCEILRDDPRYLEILQKVNLANRQRNQHSLK